MSVSFSFFLVMLLFYIGFHILYFMCYIYDVCNK